MSLRIRNLGAKLLAFLLALVVYAHVVTEKEQESQIDIPLRVSGLPDRLVLEPGAPAAARVTVRGKAKLLPVLKVKSPEMVVNLADARPGQVQRMLSPADVELPVGVNVDVTTVMEPRLATFLVDTLVASEVPVRVRTKGELPPEVCLAESLVVSPSFVRVTGPSHRLAEVTAVYTMPLDLHRLGRNQTVELRLDAGTALRCEPSSVKIRAVVSPRGTRRFSAVPVRLMNGGKAKAQPDRGEVVLDGPLSTLDSLDVALLEIRLDAGSLSPGRHFLTPEVAVPHPGLRVVEIDPTRFVVEIGQRSP